MKPFGVRMLPLVTRGEGYANGQSLRDVAALVGVDIGEETILPPEELVQRIERILEAEQRYFGQMPEDKMQGEVPGRPRSFANLAWHTFNVIDAWLEHEVEGLPLTATAYGRNAPDSQDKSAILAYGADVERRFKEWWETQCQYNDFADDAETYYAKQSKHDFLERTTWHSGQHTRQMMMILEDFIGVKPIDPLPDSMWEGLPMPEKVWDDEKPIK
jgi:hypothetical protein